MVEELDLFSFSMPEYKIKKPIRLIEMFGGIGCQAKALKNLGVEFQHWRYYEIDQNPVNSYNAIFNTEFKPQDICQVHAKDLGIDDDSYCYITTYSFPCQDISGAGKGAGYDKNSGTRSGLLWEVERILDECVEYNGKLPNILIMENVPLVIGKKHIHNFWLWRRKLESLGYTNYVELCNAKSVGWPEPLPQNRNRCFMISLLGEYHYTFPQKQPLRLKLKDMLEDSVDERYYLSERALNGMLHSSFNSTMLESRTEKDGVIPTICARDYKDPKLTFEEYDGVRINNATKKGYLEAYPGDGIDISTRPKNRRGTVQRGVSQTIQTEVTVGVIDDWVSQKGVNFICDPKRGMATDINPNVAQPLTAKGQQNWTGSFISPDISSLEKSTEIGGTEPTKINLANGDQITSNDKEKMRGLRIRKLTPKECWRLMGWDDESFEKAEQINSNSALYKQAGNGICVSCFAALMKNLL